MNIKDELPKIITELGNLYAEKMGYSSVQQINNGMCEEFRDIVLKHLEKKFTGEFFEPVCIRDFEDCDEYKHPVFKSLISLPYHAWFIYDGLHYDVTSPNGVSNFYELDNYQYYINLEEAERIKIFTELNEVEKEIWGNFVEQ